MKVACVSDMSVGRFGAFGFNVCRVGNSGCAISKIIDARMAEGSLDKREAYGDQNYGLKISLTLKS